MGRKVYIFDSHPVQYKAPVYQAIERMSPGIFEVVYASDLSVKGQLDKEFGVQVAWDTPLLSGYAYRVLNTENPSPRMTASKYGASGVWDLIRRERPAAVMLTQATYNFDRVAYLAALACGIPILIRQETQDETYAEQRGWMKSIARSLIYKSYYGPAAHAFAFGELNKNHLMAHGIAEKNISFARFSVANPLAAWSASQKQAIRSRLRAELGIADEQKVIGFFGKFIPKKNPDLILESVKHIHPDQRSSLSIMFVGAGELEPQLREMAAMVDRDFGVKSIFTGFINQSKLHEYYLASDVMTLPSRHLGETWGLVVNEALQAGCSVAITDGVGCYVEFGKLPRVKVTKSEDAESLADSFNALLPLDRDFAWASSYMDNYSTEAAAAALTLVFRHYEQRT